MNISEIREMINSTITSNGAGEITGNSLNAALMAIVDAIENVGTGNNVGTGSLGGSLTIIVGNNSNSEVREHNINCFYALKNQTEPLLVFLKKDGADKPYAQSVIRMRHLDNIGEGKSFFAFGYPVANTDEEKYGLLSFADEMYGLGCDGIIIKINLLGKNYKTNKDVTYPIDWSDVEYMNGVYTKSSSNPEVTIGMNDVEISNYNGSTITLKGLFDADVEFSNLPIVDGKITIDSTIAGGNELATSLLGPVQIPIVLNIETTTFRDNTYISRIYSENPIGVYGGYPEDDGSLFYSSFIEGLTLTRKYA